MQADGFVDQKRERLCGGEAVKNREQQQAGGRDKRTCLPRGRLAPDVSLLEGCRQQSDAHLHFELRDEDCLVQWVKREKASSEPGFSTSLALSASSLCSGSPFRLPLEPRRLRPTLDSATGVRPRMRTQMPDLGAVAAEFKAGLSRKRLGLGKRPTRAPEGQAQEPARLVRMNWGTRGRRRGGRGWSLWSLWSVVEVVRIRAMIWVRSQSLWEEALSVKSWEVGWAAHVQDGKNDLQQPHRCGPVLA